LSDVDIVALQEVWHPPFQQWFIDELKAIYPHSAAGASPACFLKLGSGLVVLSKWPLMDVGFNTFPVFDDDLGSDYSAAKGVLTATIQAGDKQIRLGVSHALTHGYNQVSKMSRHYIAVAPFQLNDSPYILGLHEDVGANIWRINDYGESAFGSHGAGKTLLKYGISMSANYKALTSFELNGHPYLFSLKNCCEQYSDECFQSRPGESYITRINDDPSTGWEDAVQLEDIQMIRDQTIDGYYDLPAIMVGDFNVDENHPIMNNIFG